jgi:hypothetical protein
VRGELLPVQHGLCYHIEVLVHSLIVPVQHLLEEEIWLQKNIISH